MSTILQHILLHLRANNLFLVSSFEDSLNIASISTNFKNDKPVGETVINYLNGTIVTFHLNERGNFCGIQKKNQTSFQMP